MGIVCLTIVAIALGLVIWSVPQPAQVKDPLPASNASDPSVPQATITPTPTPSPTASATTPTIPLTQATLPAPAGSVLVSGANDVGQRGVGGTNTESSLITQVPGLVGIRQIEVSLSNTVYAIADDGTVWAWGDNHMGLIGNGTRQDSFSPVKVPINGFVVDVVTSGSVTFAVTNDGAVWGWGQSYQSTPAVVPGLPVIKSVEMEAIGGVFGIAEDGTVWTWWDGVISMVGPPGDPHQVTGLANITELAVEYYAIFALDQDGVLWGWGSNDEGAVGVGDIGPVTTPVVVPGLPPISAITASGAAILALDRDGTLWCWGSLISGHCAQEQPSSDPSWKYKHLASPTVVEGIGPVFAIEASQYGVFALTSDGIWVWGRGIFVSYVDPGAARSQGLVQVPSPTKLLNFTGAIHFALSPNTMYALAG